MRKLLVLAGLLISGCGQETPTEKKAAENVPAASRLGARKAEFCGFAGFTLQGTGGRPVFTPVGEGGSQEDDMNQGVDDAITNLAIVEGQRTASGYKVVLSGGCSTGDESGFEVIVLDGAPAAVRQTFLRLNPQIRDDAGAYRQPMRAHHFSCAEGISDGLDYADVIDKVGGGKMQYEGAVIIPTDDKGPGNHKDLALIGTDNGKTVLYCGERYE